jgi:glucokinase
LSRRRANADATMPDPVLTSHAFRGWWPLTADLDCGRSGRRSAKKDLPTFEERKEPMAASAEAVLLGDVGATNARFAVLVDGVLGPIKWIEVAHHPTFGEAIQHFVQSHPHKHQITRALLAVAGPVKDDRCEFTNCPWTVDSRNIRDRFGLQSVQLINDFEATALSLPHLAKQDLRSLGEGRGVPGASMVVLGPGSGLGVAGLVQNGIDHVVVPTEGGHATMPANSAREDAILDFLRQRFGHVSAERILSGPGIENLYEVIAALDGTAAPPSDAAQITVAALKGACPISREALEIFCAMLGAFAGNLALTYGARGGVYIAGGIAPRILEFMVNSEFRRRFEQKGRLAAYLKAIPTQVIVHPAATFLGLRSLPGSKSPVSR